MAEYKCSLCKKRYRDARLLNCYHSFCRLCLDDYLIVSYEDGHFACPLCKEYSIVPVNGARGLPKNQYVDIRENGRQTACEFCHHKNQASSTCTDCNKKLCKACLVDHMKQQGSHNVTHLDLNQRIQTETCSKHKEQACLFYCDTCDEPICYTCNITTHQTHRSKDIASTCVILREQLGTALQDLEFNSDVNNIKRSVDVQQKRVKSYQEDSIAVIDERARELHMLVDAVRADFVSQIIHEKADNMKILEKNKVMISTNVTAIDELLQFGQMFLEHSNDIDLVRYSPKIKIQVDKLQKTDVHITEIHLKNFYSSQTKNAQYEIQRIFGSFQNSNRRPKEIKSIARLSEFRRTQSDEGFGRKHSLANGSDRYKEPFSCSDGIVTGMTFLPDGSICVCLGNEGILEFFSTNGRRKAKQNFLQQCDDIVADKKGVIYVSTKSEKKIFKVVNYENSELFADTRICVRGLGVDAKQSLLAGLTEKSSFIDREQDGCIVEITKDKTIKRVVENSNILYPARIAVGLDGRIVISDWIQMCIIICKRENIIGTYSGSSNYDKGFIPRGICCLSNGDIIVVDVASSSLHWLSPDGKMRRVVTLDDDPWSIAVDKDDTVWVGTKRGRIIPKELL